MKRKASERNGSETSRKRNYLKGGKSIRKKQQQPSRFNAMHLLYGNLNIKYSYN